MISEIWGVLMIALMIGSAIWILLSKKRDDKLELQEAKTEANERLFKQRAEYMNSQITKELEEAHGQRMSRWPIALPVKQKPELLYKWMDDEV